MAFYHFFIDDGEKKRIVSTVASNGSANKQPNHIMKKTILRKAGNIVLEKMQGHIKQAPQHVDYRVRDIADKYSLEYIGCSLSKAREAWTLATEGGN